MALSRGTRLGPYEIVASIGAGGMGEVYRARDTKLGRDIALKTLPESFADDPDRLERFKREAHFLAALNHPCIAHIHGLEDSTRTLALVMELVDGPTLAERIAGGPIAVEEALRIAKQIAEALEAAHEQGIIHRDLKPANVKVRDDGAVKVLDFGLAKALGRTGGPDQIAPASVTLSSHGTRAGMMVGTAAYMAPEQARGKAVDKRVDVWAFGCVLFEMLTGTRAFEGDDISTTLANVLTAKPNWSALPSTMPPGVRRLLRRCLERDPKQRLRDIGEARIAIDATLSGAVDEPPVAIPFGRFSWRRVVLGPAILALIAASAAGTIVWLVARSMVSEPRVGRFQITPPGTAALTINGLSRDIALTPDGSRLIYIGANGTTLFMRALDQLDVTPLVRGDALRDPFVSPDGQWVGFFDGPQMLEKVAITGGPPVLVTRLDNFEHGATWAADGTIIFATAAPMTGLQRVSADGGTPSVLTRADHTRGEAKHMWPHLLPGGQAVVYTVAATTGGLDAAAIAVLDLRSGRSTILLRGGSDAQYVASGHLVYESGGTLRAVRFDPAHLTVTGPTRALVSQVMTTSLGAADVALATDGTLVYVAGEGGAARTLVWADRQGHEIPIAAPARAYAFPRVSPEGKRLAISALDQNTDMWLWDVNHATLTRLTSDPAIDTSAVWTADGRRIVFSSNRAGALNVFTENADGTGTVERLTNSPNGQIPSGVSPDGSQVLFTELSASTGQDVMLLPLNGTHTARPLVQTPFDERNGIVSPNGRWLAYEANDTGAFEVYVQPFPSVDRRWQISTSGGREPLWAPAGRELFYVAPDGSLMRVEVSGEPDLRVGAAAKLLEGRFVVSTAGNFPRNYDVAPDGQRFLMIRPTRDQTSGGPQMVVIQHLDEELKHGSQ